MSRDDDIRDFTGRGPFSGAALSPLAGDASNRRYFRADHPTLGRAVVMDAPPEKGEDVRPFLDITARLRARGLSAPEVLDADAEAGLLLLEDLGDDLYARVLARDRAAEPMLYAAAVELLADLHAAPEAADGVAPYDLAAYRREAELITGWYLPGATGRPAPDALCEEYRALIDAALAPHLVPPAPVLVLRDYHAENLIWLPDRKGTARVGLLDYQDALAGHPAYDLVSLLEDARRDTAPDLPASMLDRYAAATGTDRAAVRAACAALGAQRNLKILGIFARLWMRDGKPAYLDLMPRVWKHLQTDLSDPALAPLARFVSRCLPAPDGDTRARLRSAR